MTTVNTASVSQPKKSKSVPFFRLNDMHPQHGDKSITIEDDTPENRALIASHLEDYKKQGFRVYVTLTEKRDAQKGFFFKKKVQIEEKVSYFVKGYDQEKNEWILETETNSTPVARKEIRTVTRNQEVTALRPCYGG